MTAWQTNVDVGPISEVRASGSFNPMASWNLRFLGLKPATWRGRANVRDGVKRRFGTHASADTARVNWANIPEELVGSLAREIMESIASARNNTLAGQNFVNMQPPDLREAREALACAVGDIDRAAAVIDRIREHIQTGTDGCR